MGETETGLAQSSYPRQESLNSNTKGKNGMYDIHKPVDLQLTYGLCSKIVQSGVYSPILVVLYVVIVLLQLITNK